MSFKKSFKKFWHFVWEEDSILSWITAIILFVILIKLIIFPSIGFILQTSHPIVAVVSGSMEHEGSFDDWWSSSACTVYTPCTQEEWYSNFNITKDMFNTFKFKNGFNKGDIMILKGVKPENVKIGDVIIFDSSNSQLPDPIIHRVVNISKQDGKYYFQTKGDHNEYSINFIHEDNISEDRMIDNGKALIRIPYLGWVKVIFTNIVMFFVNIVVGG